MKVYKYAVTLHTQLGAKSGTLIRYAGDSCSEKGYIEVLGKRNPYAARVEPTGKCTISGTICTLIRNFNFQGEGYIYPDKLEISLRGERTQCRLEGTIEEVRDEEIL